MIKCYAQTAYDKYVEDRLATTLRASGGVYGGGVARFWLYFIKNLLAASAQEMQLSEINM